MTIPDSTPRVLLAHVLALIQGSQLVFKIDLRFVILGKGCVSEFGI